MDDMDVDRERNRVIRQIQFHKAKHNQALKAQAEYLSCLASLEKKKSEWKTWSVRG